MTVELLDGLMAVPKVDSRVDLSAALKVVLMVALMGVQKVVLLAAQLAVPKAAHWDAHSVDLKVERWVDL